MADDKKKSDKGEEGGGGSNLFVDAIFWILLVIVFFSVLKGIADGLHISFDFLPTPTEFFASIFGTVQIFSIFFCLLFLIGIIYYNVKLGDLLHGGHHGHGDHDHEHAANYVETKEAIAHYDPPKDRGTNGHSDKRWQSVQSRLASHSEGDWRLAIIEADIILDEMLQRMGYHGEGIGEKLKNAEKSDFTTLDLAWEAHKIRNRIAHDGPSFHLTHEEARRVIGLFEKVFQEFYFI